MARGTLQVLLGAAPGVGKTYAMLKEGHRLQAAGKDVAVALLETHGRKDTAHAAEGMEIIPRSRIKYRGMWLEEMDLFSVIERHPDVALVDELAHTNAPGSMHEKRWQDVEDLLDAGIDVITTINVQHIESLNDVVREITGSDQKETVPDKILRSASQVKLVDLPPQALRERLAEGRVYRSDRVDAALSNYFREGNLIALRELALLWLAGNVDEKLKEYREQQGIHHKWETRERVVVALSGGPEGEQLLRRGARVAAHSGGGDLMAVHVTSEDGLRSSNPGLLVKQRELVEKLGGSFHQVVGENIATAIIDFAKANNATQIIIGVSRRGALQRWLGRDSSTNGIIAESGDIDVHIVNHDFAGKGISRSPLKRNANIQRMVAGTVFAALLVPLLAWAVSPWVYTNSEPRDVLLFQVVVVLSALIGGIVPSVVGSVLSALALDFLYIEPRGTFRMPEAIDWLTVDLSILIGVIVSLVVDHAAERTRQARKASAESEVLASISGSVLRSEHPLHALTTQLRESFGFTCVRITRAGELVASDGPMPDDEQPNIVAINTAEKTNLELYGKDVEASDQRLLMASVSQIQGLLERCELERKASEVEPLAAAEKVRSALLNAVSHDLRRPLASATAAVSGLQRSGEDLNEDDRRELLALANSSLGQLSHLVTDLLDVSRLNENAMPISLVATDVGSAIVPVLDELHIGPQKVDLDLDMDIPLVVADPPLLRRAFSNILTNAQRYNPRDMRLRISASTFQNRVEIRISDHGPGVPDARKDDIFAPFHRLGDTDNTTGLGLGMVLSKGFVESMGGELTAEDTPGGGLTMVVALTVADPHLSAGQPIPKNAHPIPADQMEQNTLDVSNAVSGLILPIQSGNSPALSEEDLNRLQQENEQNGSLTGGDSTTVDLAANGIVGGGPQTTVRKGE